MPMPELPESNIPTSEIISTVQQAKEKVESLGYRFRTIEERQQPGAPEFSEDEKWLAFYVTVLAAWELNQKYPNEGIGLEFYRNGLEVGGDKYSFDIILLTKRGPSCDVMASGVKPAAGIEKDPKYIPDWTNDWRPVIQPWTVNALKPLFEGHTDPNTTPDPTPPPTPPTVECKFQLQSSCECQCQFTSTDLSTVLTAIQELSSKVDALMNRPIPRYNGKLGLSINLKPVDAGGNEL